MANTPTTPLEAALREFPPESGIRIDQDGRIYPPASPDHPQAGQSGRYRLTLGPGSIEIPSYDEQALERLIPGVLERIDSETGKILFINLGFSTLPLVPSRKYLNGELKDPPVIANGFDICQVRDDLLNIQEFLGGPAEVDPRQLNRYSFNYRFLTALNNIESLYSAIQEGTLIPVDCIFGSGNVPQELMAASLAVSPYNPLAGKITESSLHEQLAALAPGGELYLNLADWKLQGLQFGYQTRAIRNLEGKAIANIVRREA
jgi:hypothetical protein